MLKELATVRSRRSFKGEWSEDSLSPRARAAANEKGKEKKTNEQIEFEAHSAWLNKRWPKVVQARKDLLPVEKVASLRESFRLLDDWTKMKKKIEVQHLSMSAPEKVYRKKIVPKRPLSWYALISMFISNVFCNRHLKNSWDYEPFYWNVEKWKAKVAKMQHLPAGSFNSPFFFSLEAHVSLFRVEIECSKPIR